MAQHPHRVSRGSLTGRTVLEAKVVQIPDIKADPEYILLAPISIPFRTTLGVPLMREGKPIGVIALTRNIVRPFAERQIELMKTFADQAVIAIENTRLLNELRQRTDDLSEALDQQTATSEVLGVISSSPGELEPVFQAILENATQICESQFGALYRSEGDGVRCVGVHNAPEAFVEERRRNPVIKPAPATVFGRALATKLPAQIADIRDEVQSSDMARLQSVKTIFGGRISSPAG